MLTGLTQSGILPRPAAPNLQLTQDVRELVSRTLDVPSSSVLPSSTFEELGADSLDRFELVLATEEQFQLRMADEDAERIRSVADLVRYVEHSR